MMKALPPGKVKDRLWRWIVPCLILVALETAGVIAVASAVDTPNERPAQIETIDGQIITGGGG